MRYDDHSGCIHSLGPAGFYSLLRNPNSVLYAKYLIIILTAVSMLSEREECRFLRIGGIITIKTHFGGLAVLFCSLVNCTCRDEFKKDIDL